MLSANIDMSLMAAITFLMIGFIGGISIGILLSKSSKNNNADDDGWKKPPSRRPHRPHRCDY
jgi:hypothetical protein